MGKAIPLALVFLSIAAGAALGWARAGKPDVRRILQRSTPGRQTQPPPRLSLPPERVPDVREIPATPMARGDSLFQDLRFREARLAYADAAGAETGVRAAKARRLEVLSEIFDLATRRIPRSLAAEAPHEVVLSNDRVLVGRVTLGIDGSVSLRTDQGISATFPPEQVASVRRVETAAWRAACEANLKNRLDKIGHDLPPALDYYQAAYFCIRNGLGDRAADLLMRCADEKGFPLVIETFGGKEAGRLLARWEEATPPTAEPTPAPTPIRTGDELIRAEELYRQGLAHYRRAFPGMEGAGEELKRARDLFEKAREAYENAGRALANDPEIESRIQSIQTLIYDCIKRAQL